MTLCSEKEFQKKEIMFSRLHAEGTTVVVVTHEEEIAAFTKRIIRFRDGQIISDKPNVPRRPEGVPGAAGAPGAEELADSGEEAATCS